MTFMYMYAFGLLRDRRHFSLSLLPKFLAFSSVSVIYVSYMYSALLLSLSISKHVSLLFHLCLSSSPQLSLISLKRHLALQIKEGEGEEGRLEGEVELEASTLLFTTFLFLPLPHFILAFNTIKLSLTFPGTDGWTDSPSITFYFTSPLVFPFFSSRDRLSLTVCFWRLRHMACIFGTFWFWRGLYLPLSLSLSPSMERERGEEEVSYLFLLLSLYLFISIRHFSFYSISI